jgi:hypothetical protein
VPDADGSRLHGQQRTIDVDLGDRDKVLKPDLRDRHVQAPCCAASRAVASSMPDEAPLPPDKAFELRIRDVARSEGLEPPTF